MYYPSKKQQNFGKSFQHISPPHEEYKWALLLKFDLYQSHKLIILALIFLS